VTLGSAGDADSRAGRGTLSAHIRKRFAGGFELAIELEAPAGITVLFGRSGSG